MGTNLAQVMTLANSIIGVSVLAMPFCFKQCGVILSVILLVLSSILSRLACHFLLKAAIITRRRNYEFLAFHIFGSSGKLAVELCIIGFLLGTCIAFFVVMGDLGPAIISSVFGIHQTDTLRTTVLIVMALVVVLPLGLLRNVESLHSVCTASVVFYVCLVLKVVGEAANPLLTGDWLINIKWWNPEGVLQCLPIFSMALFCQTQLFEIFDTVPNAVLEKINVVVRAAINMCTLVYICVGFFGYVAFSGENITGNILVSLSETVSTEVIKLGFVLSVAVSFPLVIFPCRASLYSLLFRSAQPPVHDMGSSHVPEGRFKMLTFFIVGVSLTLGLILPNIERVLGLVGSTIGITICIVLPALLLSHTTRQPRDKLVAQGILSLGLVIMVLGTYAHLNAGMALAVEKPFQQEIATERPRNDVIKKLVETHESAAVDFNNNNNVKNSEDKSLEKPVAQSVEKIPELSKSRDTPAEAGEINEKRQEPPIPVEPIVKKSEEGDPLRKPQMESLKDENQKHDVKKETSKEEKKVNAESNAVQDMADRENLKLIHEVKKDKEAEEEEERKNEETEEKKKAEDQKLAKILENHEVEQRNLLQEQKKILEEIKLHEHKPIIKQNEILKDEDSVLKKIPEQPLQKEKVRESLGRVDEKSADDVAADLALNKEQKVNKKGIIKKLKNISTSARPLDNPSARKSPEIAVNQSYGQLLPPKIIERDFKKSDTFKQAAIPIPLAYRNQVSSTVSSKKVDVLPAGREILEADQNHREKRQAAENIGPDGLLVDTQPIVQTEKKGRIVKNDESEKQCDPNMKQEGSVNKSLNKTKSNNFNIITNLQEKKAVEQSSASDSPIAIGGEPILLKSNNDLPLIKAPLSLSDPHLDIRADLKIVEPGRPLDAVSTKRDFK